MTGIQHARLMHDSICVPCGHEFYCVMNVFIAKLFKSCAIEAPIILYTVLFIVFIFRLCNDTSSAHIAKQNERMVINDK